MTQDLHLVKSSLFSSFCIATGLSAIYVRFREEGALAERRRMGRPERANIRLQWEHMSVQLFESPEAHGEIYG